MKAFLLLAHGSRRAQSNEEVQKLADCFGLQNQGEYPIVIAGFMELAEPTIPMIVDEAISAGATHLVILPYFLAAGTHVVDDIPTLVQTSLTDYPEVSFEILPHIGGAKGMVNLIHSVATESE